MPTPEQSQYAHRLAHAYLDWWAGAGVDCAVTDQPHNWLKPVVAKAVPAIAPAAPLAVVDHPSNRPSPEQAPAHLAAPTAPMPGDIASFRTWLADEPGLPDAGHGTPRILPEGPANAPLMLVLDMPSAADVESGRLLTGAEGELIDAMLRAVGLARGQVAVASLLLSRPAGGVADEAVLRQILPRFRHYLGLMQPERLLLLGDRTSRALGSTDGGGIVEYLPAANHERGTLSAMDIPAPFVLMQQPARKQAVWKSLRKLVRPAA